MLKNISFTFKGRRASVNAKKCDYFEKILGLMFKSKNNAEALLFEFKKPVGFQIHSFFVFFPFVAIWLDEKNKVLDYRIVKPFSLHIAPQKPFRKLLEIPLNEKNMKISRFFVGKQKI